MHKYFYYIFFIFVLVFSNQAWAPLVEKNKNNNSLITNNNDLNSKILRFNPELSIHNTKILKRIEKKKLKCEEKPTQNSKKKCLRGVENYVKAIINQEMQNDQGSETESAKQYEENMQASSNQQNQYQGYDPIKEKILNKMGFTQVNPIREKILNKMGWTQKAR